MVKKKPEWIQKLFEGLEGSEFVSWKASPHADWEKYAKLQPELDIEGEWDFIRWKYPPEKDWPDRPCLKVLQQNGKSAGSVLLPVSSKRLKRELLPFLNEDGAILILRKGSGQNTEYAVFSISDEEFTAKKVELSEFI